MARTKKTPAINIPPVVTDGMIHALLEASVNVGDSANTNEHTETAVPISNPETDQPKIGETGGTDHSTENPIPFQPNIGETGGTDHSTENPIPSKTDKRTITKRQKRAMMKIIVKDHGK